MPQSVAAPLVLSDGDRSRLEGIDLAQLGTDRTGASSRWWPCVSRGRSSFRASCIRSRWVACRPRRGRRGSGGGPWI